MIKVKWDDKVCSHSGVCVKTLPKVFKVENGQFVIDTKAASEQDIRATVDKCPSGALSVVE
jgi:uncharacterized Fe-S cluster protein YjdI